MTGLDCPAEARAFRGWRGWVLQVLALLCLVGCAAPVAPPDVRDSATELVRHGRFALKAEEFGRAPEAVQGGFDWHDTGAVLILDLTNPFGSVLARVQVSLEGSVLTRANGEVIRAATPDALLQRVLGQTMPVQGLRDWLRSQRVPGPAMTVQDRDEQGRIVVFEQGGWTVRLSRFDALGPKMLVMTRQEGSKNISLRLVVDAP